MPTPLAETVRDLALKVAAGPRFHPVVRQFERAFDATGVVTLRVPIGRLTLLGEPDRTDGQLRVLVRSNSEDAAAQVAADIEPVAGDTRITFSGPFANAGPANVSLDLQMLVPARTVLHAHVHLGKVRAYGIGTTCAIESSLGAVYVALADGWSGDLIDVRSALGDVALQLPHDLRVNVASRTTGVERVQVTSSPDGVPVSAIATFGNLRVTRRRSAVA